MVSTALVECRSLLLVYFSSFVFFFVRKCLPPRPLRLNPPFLPLLPVEPVQLFRQVPYRRLLGVGSALPVTSQTILTPIPVWFVNSQRVPQLYQFGKEKRQAGKTIEDWSFVFLWSYIIIILYYYFYRGIP